MTQEKNDAARVDSGDGGALLEGGSSGEGSSSGDSLAGGEPAGRKHDPNDGPTLDSLKAGQCAIIKAVRGHGELRRHLLDMGLTPGIGVRVRKVAPMGDPIQIELRGYELTLRLDDARFALIEPVESLPKTPVPVEPLPRASAHPGIGEVSATGDDYIRNLGEPLSKGAPITFALAGNQNCGKTTLFNQLTGANQHVGNFPGVTVDKKEGQLRRHPEATVVDLPGVYSLSPYSNEEVVTRDFLIKEKPTAIINIVDATNIERNLYLTLQLMELNIPMVLALNMMDELSANGGSVRINELEAALGIPVVPISAVKNQGIDELVDHAMHVAMNREVPGYIDFCPAGEKSGDPLGEVHRCVHAFMHLIDPYAKAAGLPVRFAATKMVEGDPLIERELGVPEREREALTGFIEALERQGGLDREAALANMRFSFIERLCARTIVRPHESREHVRSVAADRILTGRFTAIPCFILIMGFVFLMTFSWLGAWLSDWLQTGIDFVIGAIGDALTAAEVSPIVSSLVTDGICGGVGSVLGFLPVIVTLFLFLSILEDSGYMARVAFVMDKPLRRLGLSGRSFVPMLMGFGCSVPAIMASRTLSSERDRKMTILLVPFMSCSAKLPIYGLLTSVFFPPEMRGVVVLALYLLGMAVGVLYALALKRFKFAGEPVPFVMELPNYRLPSAKSVLRLVWDKAKGFIQKAFTVVFLATLVIWFLQTFDAGLGLVASADESLLALIGGAIAPLFAPLGFGDWRASTALLTGFMAKESVVSTLTVLVGGGVAALQEVFTPFTAFVFLVFTLLYTPCVAAIATVKKETNGRTAAKLVVSQCVVAWAAAFCIRAVGLAFGLA